MWMGSGGVVVASASAQATAVEEAVKVAAIPEARRERAGAATAIEEAVKRERAVAAVAWAGAPA